jgi:hypothetical protein
LNRFIEKYSDKINGVLSGFDRLVIKGTIKALSYTAGMMNYLYNIGVLLKDFGEYVEEKSKMLKEASFNLAEMLKRPIKYLPSSKRSKEEIAKDIAYKDNITGGLVCLLTCVEPCISYYIRRDRESKKLILEPKERKCLHIYQYWIDPIFGFMNVRIQTWFPYSHISLLKWTGMVK